MLPKVNRKPSVFLLAIVGPTASSKSELAVFLAKEIKKHALGGYRGAEIISADSRQVYKYLDVGTNKVPGKWQPRSVIASPSITLRINSAKQSLRLPRRPGATRTPCNDDSFMYKSIPHHCIDFVHPKKTYTVAEYKKCAEQAISEITERGNIPLLVGGTGFYIQAVVDGITIPEVPPNQKLRRELEKKSTEQLFATLQKLDPNRAASIDEKNPRRIIRAIEIATALGIVPVAQKQSSYNVLMIGVKKPDVELKAAIAKRSKKQIPGLVKEIKLLRKLKIPQKRIRELGFEYCIIGGSTSDNYQGLNLRYFAEQLAQENWRYAKRQMTWFKRDKRIQWIRTRNEAKIFVKDFLTRFKK